MLKKLILSTMALSVLALINTGLAGEIIPADESVWKNYYDRNSTRDVSSLLVRGLEFVTGDMKSMHALDVGCGQGIETYHLLQRGFKVQAFDYEELAIKLLNQRIPSKFQSQLTTEVASFSDATWPEKLDFIWAGKSLPFAHPEKFPAIWNKIRSSLKPGGLFVGHLFGNRDSWATREKQTYLSRTEVNLLLIGFDVLDIREIDRFDRSTDELPAKRWHYYEIIARKK